MVENRRPAGVAGRSGYVPWAMTVARTESILRICIAFIVTLLQVAATSFCADPTKPVEPQETLTIESAVAQALRHNLDLMAESGRIDIADAALITAGRRPNPTLNFTSDHLDLLGAGFSEINGGGPPEIAIATDFTLERGKKRRRRVELAAAERDLVGWELADRRRNLILDTQSAFVDLLEAQKALELARETLTWMQQLLSVNEARLESGDLAEVEVKRTRIAALQSEHEVRRAEMKVFQAQNQLGLLLGRETDCRRLRAGGDFRSDRDEIHLESLLKLALENRPDLRAGAQEENRALADLNLQRAQSTLDFNVGAEYRRQQGVNGESNSIGFTFSVPLPFWDRNQGEIARAERERRYATQKKRALAAMIRAELDDAFRSYLTSRSVLQKTEQEMLKPAQEVKDVVLYSYRRGEASFLEVLDAQRAFNETMHTYLEAQAEYARNLYLIDAVTGRNMNP